MTNVVRHSNLRAALLACTALCAVAVTHPAVALPQNGVVVAGSAKIIDKANKVVVIEKSPTAVIDWSSFNIAAGQKVIFIQASSLDTVVNQVMGGAGTQILGQLSGKGTVIITNPNGILFGDTAKVKVGAIIATTAQMSPAAIAALMAGGPASFDIASTSPTASVVNRGSITVAEAGLVGLVAPGVENDGIIQARLGTVQLAAGNTFTIDLYGDKLIKLAPGDQVLSLVTAADGTPLKALVDNSGTITADGGTITLTASAARTILTSVINMDGITQARSVGTQNGEIVLDGGTTGTVQVASTLDTTGALPGQTGGNIAVKGDVVALGPTAVADATGAAGGGTIAIGTMESTSTSLEAGSQLTASATGQGNGGNITVLGGNTTVAATISALGVVGGQVETSDKTLNIDGAVVKAGNWLLDPTDLTVTQAAAASIDSALATGGVTLQTTASGSSGFGTANASGSGDIIISSPIAWSANTTLTLDAYHSVLVNANITPTGSGAGLTVKYNDGGTGGNLLTGAGASVTLPGTAALTINGQTYTLITSAAALQAMGTSGYYALAGNIDASSIANFTPIGFTSGTNSSPTVFTGTLEGFGNSISNLNIRNASASYLGLFSDVSSSGVVRNLGLQGGSVTGGTGSYFGMLAGMTAGTINNDFTTGAVAGGSFVGGLVGYNSSGTVSSSYATGAVTGSEFIGGLVGDNNTGTLSRDYATGAVSGGSNSSNIGGLAGESNGNTLSSSASGAVSAGANSTFIGGLIGNNIGGYNSGGLVSSCSATGPVTGGVNSSYIGGLAGYNTNNGTITNSYATGSVTGLTGSYLVGGLVGYNLESWITSSYSTGNTAGGTQVGGIVGDNYGILLSNSYATGSVSGSSSVGGLVGVNETSILSSYASGPVNSGQSGAGIGGLVGENFGNISSSYASGAVGGSSYVGGLIGYNVGTVSMSYSLGSVSGVQSTNAIGGLIGLNVGTVTSSYWDTTISRQLTSSGGIALTDAQMKQQTNYTGWDFTNTWYQFPGAYPILRSSPYVLTITATQSMNYGGALPQSATYSNLWGSDTSSVITGLSLSTTATSASPVGGYSMTASGASATSSTGHAYTIIYVPGTLTVNPTPLTWSVANAASTVGTTPTLGTATLAGIIGTDVVTGTVTAFNSSNVAVVPAATTAPGTYTEDVTGLTGAASANYILASIGDIPGILTIRPAPPIVSIAMTNQVVNNQVAAATSQSGSGQSTAGAVNASGQVGGGSAFSPQPSLITFAPVPSAPIGAPTTAPSPPSSPSGGFGDTGAGGGGSTPMMAPQPPSGGAGATDVGGGGTSSGSSSVSGSAGGPGAGSSGGSRDQDGGGQPDGR